MTPSFDDLLTVVPDGVRLTVRAKPGARQASKAGSGAMRIVPIADGQRALEIAVSAAPEDGKANKAIIEALADALGVRRQMCQIKTGHTGRIKVITITGDGAQLSEIVTRFLKTL